MKKQYHYFSILIVMIALIGFSACKDNDDGGISVSSATESETSTDTGDTGGDESPPAVYLFSGGTSSGNLGGRSGADARCAAKKLSSYPTLTCSNVRAFISFDAIDDIQDMAANYSIPTNLPVLGPTDLEYAPNWNTVIVGTTTLTLAGAGIAAGSLGWWSGSTAGGVSADGQDCADWTSSGAVTSYAGSTYQTGSQRFYFNSQFCSDTAVETLCVCW